MATLEERNAALRGATARGNGDLVIALLDAGASPNTTDSLGNAPLCCAVEQGDAKIVTALLSRGADKSVLSYIGYSPTRLAIKAGHWPVIEVLLNAGVWGSGTFGDASLISLLLLAAGTSSDPRIFSGLLSRGVDINACDTRGFTAIHRAAMHGPEGSIDALVGVGADPCLKSTANGWSPLHRAALHGNCSALVALLRHGADVNATDNAGSTALHTACRRGIRPFESTVAGLLLRWGADETMVDNEDQTPEVLACMRDDGDAKERLLVVLARAAVDRNWRRRHWAVILRSRLDKERVKRLSTEPGGGSNGLVGKDGGGGFVEGGERGGGVGSGGEDSGGAGVGGEGGGVGLKGGEGGAGLGEGGSAGVGGEEGGAGLEEGGGAASEGEGGAGSGEGGSAESGEEDDGEGVLGWLVALPEEGVFRMIIMFL